jgi:hypothetical protein
MAKGEKLKPDPKELADVDNVDETCPLVQQPDPVESGLVNAMCQRGECGHFLTVHSLGMAIHGRCLLVGCKCTQAVLTEAAVIRVKKGILP